MLDQRGDVFTSLTQWRENEGENVHAMEEVLAKFSVVNQRFQVAMCGHDYADVHGDRLVAADALDLAFFEHAQKLWPAWPEACLRFRPGKSSRAQPARIFQDDERRRQ